MKRFVCALLLAASFVGSVCAQGMIGNIPSILDGEPSDRTRVWFMVDDLGLAKTRRINLDHLRNLITGPTVKATSDLASLSNLATGTVVHVLGYSTTGDGGEGFFWLDTSGTLGAGAANGGTIFAAPGGTNWYWRRMLPSKRITPQMFGAVADNVADDTTAIVNAAAAAAALNSPTIVKPELFFPYGLYKTLSTITIKENIDIIMEGELIYAGGSQSAAGLVVGTTDVQNANVTLRLQVGRNGVSDWTNEGSIAIKLINTSGADVRVAVCTNANIAAGGYTIGVQCIGSATGAGDKGFTHCNVRLDRIFNCKYQLELANESAGAGKGYVNSNRFFGGSLVYGGGTGSGLSRYGVRVHSIDGNNKIINNNSFYGLSIELRDADAGAGEALPVLIVHGQDNIWKDIRNEANGPVVMRVEDDPTSNNRNNHIEWTHTDATIDDRSRSASSTGGFVQDRRLNRPMRLLFDSGPMDRTIHYYDTGNVHIPDVHLMRSVDGDTTKSNDADTGFDAFASSDFTVDTATDEIISTAHEMRVDDKVFFTTTGTLPASTPAINNTDPFTVSSTTADRFKIENSAGTAIDFTGAGTPTNTYHGRTRYITVAVNYGMGVYVDTSRCKQFVVTRDIDTGSANEGRVVIIPYNDQGVRLVDNVTFTTAFATSNVNLNATAHGLANGEQVYLSSSGALPTGLAINIPYFVVNATANDFEVSLTLGGASETFSDDGSGTHKFDLVNRWVKGQPVTVWSTVFGGGYWHTPNLTEEPSFWVRSEVKRVNVVVVCASGTMRIRKFQIHVPESERTPDVWIGYNQGGPNRAIALNAPTAGVYTDIGQTIWDDTPVNLTPPGWTLSAGGRPGTWLNRAAFGALAP